MITVVGYTLTMLLVLALAMWSVHLQEIEKENKAKEAYLSAAGELYEVLRIRVEKRRKYRHDLAKHIRTLEMLSEKLAQQGDWQHYIDGLREQSRELNLERLCQDDLVDAVMAIKQRQCKKSHTVLELDVQDCMYGGIKDIDLIGVLENLLDNALEAQERISDHEKRWIRLQMRRKDDLVQIAVDNRIAAGEKVDYHTGKAHPEEHGLGFRIVDQLVKSYHGTKSVSADSEKGLFHVELCLRVQEDGTASTGEVVER